MRPSASAAPAHLPAAGCSHRSTWSRRSDAPERLAVDDDVGRAEDAAADRRVDFAAQPVLDRVRRSARVPSASAVDAELRRDVERHFGRRDVAVLREIGVVERQREALGERRVAGRRPSRTRGTAPCVADRELASAA